MVIGTSNIEPTINYFNQLFHLSDTMPTTFVEDILKATAVMNSGGGRDVWWMEAAVMFG